MNNKTYDTLKYLTQIVLPAVGTLYFSLAQIWAFPKGEEVVGTIVSITAFLGVILRISTKQYEASGAAYDGYIAVEDTGEGVQQFSLVLDSDPEELRTKSNVNFKMRDNTENRA